MSVNRWDLTPSARAHGAQKVLSATTLGCEAFVVFFATLAAHALDPSGRGINWTMGLLLVAALALTAALLRGGFAWPYWLGLVLQVAMISYGLVVPAMFAVGGIFALIYVIGLVKGRDMDTEKDEIDRQFYARENAKEKETEQPKDQ